MTALRTMRMNNPAHPGSFVKTEIIAPLGLSVTDAAQALGVTRAMLSILLNEHQRVSPEMRNVSTTLRHPGLEFKLRFSASEG